MKTLEQTTPSKRKGLRENESSSPSSAGEDQEQYDIDDSGTDEEAEEEVSGDDDDDGGDGHKTEKRRRGGQMTEERRLAIKLALQGRGPLDSEHKRRISNAMRVRYASDPSLNQAGKPKKCSVCGASGHNKKKCRVLVLPSSSEQQQQLQKEEEGEGERSGKGKKKRAKIDAVVGSLEQKEKGGSSKKLRSCGYCGGVGHNIRSCPEAAAAAAATVTSKEEEKIEIKVAVASPPPPPPPPSAAAAAAVAGVVIEKIGVEDRYGNVTIIHDSSSMDDEDENNGGAAGVGNATIKKTSSLETKKKISPPSPPPKQKKTPKLLKSGELSPEKEAAIRAAFPPPPVELPSFTPRLLRTLPGATVALTEDGSLVFPLPASPEQCIAQASGAVLRAWGDGIRRQSLELLLPQTGSFSETGDEWPGGIRQQFRAALPMIESLLLRLKRAEGLEGRITAEWLDEGDCVGAWQSERLAAVLFPTADALPAMRRIDDALSGERLIVVVNPQWQPQGQIVSDFGFGAARKAAERYVASLEEVYYLRKVIILGDEVRVLRCFPARWQVHYVRAAGDAELVSIEEEKPSSDRLLELLKGVRGSRASKSWLDRALDRRYYDDIAAYNERFSEEGEDDDDEAAAVEEGVVRDIITGEIISRR